ncbi:MAG: class I SAM-dependent rRNA methyltransferase [Deltaproteobacteria bacterium]|nr:class I SAM-dependent rRNA methyltransferase [Deltaproteobacteria bacterium]
MDIAILKRTSRINAGHLWVFSNELDQSPRGLPAGGLVELRDKKDNFFGIGYCNPNSLISIRILSRERCAIDEAFFIERITQALAFRKRFIKDTDAYRAVFSESDALPGLIVDRYADCVSIQLLTLGMDALADMVISAVDAVMAPKTIVLRNDSSARSLEGISLEKRLVKGLLDPLPIIHDARTLFEADPLGGQKTGFFLDQAANRRAFAGLVDKGHALDLFCYSGAWGIKLAEAGATVTGVDASEAAVAQALRNARINGLEERCRFVKSDVFDFVKAEVVAKRAYDNIVLDPPAFVKSKAKIAEAMRAYKELNVLCMKILKPHGLLATSSCSHHIDYPAFMGILRDAAREAGRRARVIETRSQPPDHPVSLAMPETEYLKCVILEVS